MPISPRPPTWKSGRMDVASELPELLQLLQELNAKAGEVSEQVSSLREEASEFDTEHGVSLLEVKNHLLLSYVCNLSQVLLMKTEGEPIAECSAVGRIVEIRTVLEKVRPLDQKLSYQIDKLIRTSTTGISDVIASDPLRFKANPANLVAKLADSEASDGGDGCEGGEDSTKLYVPPRLKAMHYEDSSSSHRKKTRKLNSSILQDLRSEFTDAPEEIHDIGTRRRKVVQEEREKESFEEAHMIRLSGKPGTKRSARSEGLDDIVPFGEPTERRQKPSKRKKKWKKPKGRRKAKHF